MNLQAVGKDTKGKVKTSGVSPFQELPIEKVYPNPNQPRKSFNNIEELAATISEHGLLQPISVVKKDDGYMITAGERRYKAHLFNNAKTIKAHIVKLDDHQVKELALIENIQRDDLTDFEKAKYIGELWASGEYKKKSDLAAKIGKSPSYISKAFGCLKLDETIIRDIEANANDISLSVLEEISRVKDTDIQKEVYEKYLDGVITRDDIKDFKSGPKDQVVLQEVEPRHIEIKCEFSQGKEKLKEAFEFTPNKWSAKGFEWIGDPWEEIHEKLDENKTYKITIEEL